MSANYASGRKAIAICDVCGFVYKLRELRHEIVKGVDTNIKACPTCWDPDQPQLHLGETPVYDPQALREPRPDSPNYPESRGFTVLLTTMRTSGLSGQLRVVVT